ncbi:hypothetical protein [Microvenator marinus]|uniref:hypothetical protein n=1 Tax=Microvenator marinus TaxID=2600177 RepID=UPI00201B4671|nr:hypothetical protein [Microvenator marinus]
MRVLTVLLISLIFGAYATVPFGNGGGMSELEVLSGAWTRTNYPAELHAAAPDHLFLSY